MAHSRLTRVIAPLAALAITAAGALALATPSQAAVLGTLTISPVSGNNGSVITVDTSAPCDKDNSIVTVAGAGITSPIIVGNTPNLSYMTNASGGLIIPLGTMTDFLSTQSPVPTPTGRYDFTVNCRNAIGGTVFGTFTGSIWYSSSTAWKNSVPATTTTVSALPIGSAMAGDSVEVKATVVPSGAAGSVQFKDGGLALGSPVAVSGGIATLSTTALSQGAHTLTAEFTPTDPDAFAASTSAGLSYTINAPSAPLVTIGATATGSYKVGSTLTCAATFSGEASRTYAWFNNGVTIGGATTNKLALTGSYYNRSISCQVSATNAIGTTASTSSTHKIAAGTIAKKSSPSISGTAKYGKTLTCSHGTWSPTGVTYSYQWKRNGAAISGTAAKKSAYKVAKADKGKKLTCTVTVKKTGYSTATATTAAKTVAR